VRETQRAEKKWALSQEAFDSLLILLDSDRELAGIKYEKLRLKLLKYFEWMNSETPESLADETLDRVARKLYEGSDIYNLESYVYSVAKNILFEFKRKENKEVIAHGEYNTNLHSTPEPESERLVCLKKCLNVLSNEDKEIIICYYEEEKHEKIESRKQIASNLGVTLTALRVRVCRLRAQIEVCLNQCLRKSVNEK